VVAIGRHAELLATNDLYRKLASRLDRGERVIDLPRERPAV
jgi:hypothetical protein